VSNNGRIHDQLLVCYVEIQIVDPQQFHLHVNKTEREVNTSDMTLRLTQFVLFMYYKLVY